MNLTKYLKMALTGLFLVGSGIVIGKTMIKPDVREIIREVKVVEVVTVIDETKRVEKRPDGTVIEETTKRTDKRRETTKNKESVKEVKHAKLDWAIGAYTNGTQAVAVVNRRILGNIYVGAYVRSTLAEPLRPEGGLGVMVTF